MNFIELLLIFCAELTMIPFLVLVISQRSPANSAAYAYSFSESFNRITNIAVKLEFPGSKYAIGLKHRTVIFNTRKRTNH